MRIQIIHHHIFESLCTIIFFNIFFKSSNYFCIKSFLHAPWEVANKMGDSPNFISYNGTQWYSRSSTDSSSSQCISELRQRLLKIAISKQPQILSTVDNEEIKVDKFVHPLYAFSIFTKKILKRSKFEIVWNLSLNAVY